MRRPRVRTSQRRMMMRTARMLGGLAIVLLSAGSARAEPMKYTITFPEVMVTSGPSPEFYPTSKLRQGDTVCVVKEEVTGWLAIVPPQGSFSWINTRLVERFGANSAVVCEAEAQIWVGSRLINSKPTVRRTKVMKGTQLTVIGEPVAGQDGTWLPILPAPSEVRYIRAEEARPSTAPQLFGTAPPEPARSSSTQASLTPSRPAASGLASVPPASNANDSVSPPPSRSGTNPLWLQAEEAEHLREFQDRPNGVTDSPTRLATANSNNAAASDRLVPAPSSSSSTPFQLSRASSEYCYLRDSGYPVRLSPPVVSAPNPPPSSNQWSEPGLLRRTAFSDVDGRPLFRLEPLDASKRHMYVAADANVNLEPYVEKNVYLCGPVVYRGDLRTNYMTVLQVSPAR